MNTNILLILVLSFVVTSCSQTENINEKNIHLHVKELSSDKFEGREPGTCLLYTSPSPRDQRGSRMPASA